MKSKAHTFFGTGLTIVDRDTGKHYEIVKGLLLDKHHIYVEDDTVFLDFININNEYMTTEVVTVVREYCNRKGKPMNIVTEKLTQMRDALSTVELTDTHVTPEEAATMAPLERTLKAFDDRVELGLTVDMLFVKKLITKEQYLEACKLFNVLINEELA